MKQKEERTVLTLAVIDGLACDVRSIIAIVQMSFTRKTVVM